MTVDPRSIPAPRGLGKRGKTLWKSVVSAYKLRPDEQILLETACRTLDQIVELEAALVGQPLTTRGSMGQEREHPLLPEIRLQRVVLNRTLAQLKLPDDFAAGNQHRSAAQSRWQRSRAGQ